MESIGGYFELELRKGEHFHKDAIRLNTARNCFEYVLRSKKYAKVYIPYYTCEAMLEPIRKLNTKYEYYHINLNLEPTVLPRLEAKEAFLYTNYFGLKQECVKRLASDYGGQLIVDNAQAFYAEPLEGIDTFYSARKFFGVPDGAYLYTNKPLKQEFEQDYSNGRMPHLLKRIDLNAEEGYLDYCMNESSLCNQEIKKMSRLTAAIMAGVDYEDAMLKRRENYKMLDELLGATNLMYLGMDEEAVPMVYPYLTKVGPLKQHLIDSKVFVASYWPNVVEMGLFEEIEYALASNAAFIPIDQRYGQKEMRRIIDLVNTNLK